MPKTINKNTILFDYAPRFAKSYQPRKGLSHFHFFLIIVGVLGFLFGLTLGMQLYSQQNELVSPLPTTLNYLEAPQVYAAETALVATESAKPEGLTYEGHVSYYSHDGCLGCSENQTMGNGQPFDENAMTLAVPCELIRNKTLSYYKNNKVLVTNVSTGKSIEARITDCGGFSKYGRIADLSKGLYQALEAKTDKTIIKMEVL